MVVGHAMTTVEVWSGQSSGQAVGHGGVRVAEGILSQLAVGRALHPEPALQILVEVETTGGMNIHLALRSVFL